MKNQHTPQSIDELIEKLDKWLIEKGLKPTEPTNKEGTFIQITNKPKNKLTKDTKVEENDIKSN